MNTKAFVVGLVFVTLKLAHVITWPWLWVLAPFWVTLAIGVIALIIVIAMKGYTK